MIYFSLLRDWIYKKTMARLYKIIELWPTISTATNSGKPNHSICIKWHRKIRTNQWWLTLLFFALPLNTGLTRKNQIWSHSFVKMDIIKILEIIFLISVLNSKDVCKQHVLKVTLINTLWLNYVGRVGILNFSE